jgi:hypothetical protein
MTHPRWPNLFTCLELENSYIYCIVCRLCKINEKKGKAVPLHAMEALGGRGGIAPTHSRPRN